MPSIHFENVVKQYNRSGPKAVAGLTLDVTDGDFLCLLGPSGCGKTTTLRMLAGLESLTSGRITIGDRVVDDVEKGVFVPPEKRALGMVFQSYALWPHLSVEKNVEFGLRLGGEKGTSRRDATDLAMRRLGIEHYRDRYPSELSGGQQQRVALARTLIVEPGVILMDEPLSNLDAKLRLDMRAELKRIHADSKSTFVFVTHDQWEAMTLATTIAVMCDGVLQQVGTPDDIYSRPKNRFVAEFVGSPPINVVELNSSDDDLAAPLREYLMIHGSVGGQEIGSIGIRPESIRLTDSIDGSRNDSFSAPGTLVGILPTGGSWILELALFGGRRIFAVTSSEPTQEEGSNIHIYVRREEFHVFDGEGLRMRLPAGAATTGERIAPDIT